MLKLNPMYEIPNYWLMNPIMLPNLSRAEAICRHTCLSCLRKEKKCKRDFTWILG